MKTQGLLVCWTQVCFCCSGDHFPLEARHHLAPWIDQNFTADLDLGNPQHEEHAQRLVMELVAQLESKERPPLAATKLMTQLCSDESFLNEGH